MKDLKMWTRIFKGLANFSRLKIITVLFKEGERAVSDIAPRIHVSFAGTSKHLMYLAGLGILDREGKNGKVFYSINREMDPHVRIIIGKFLP